MELLRTLIEEGEDRLLERILDYAKKHNFVKYTSTLKEDWRMSIAGISASFLSLLEERRPDLEFGPDEDFRQDPAAWFGITEAQRHRERGVSLPMFLGLLKYYRQSYIDVVCESELPSADLERFRRCVERFFDRMEIGICMGWTERAHDELLEELQSTNRILTNEKNKYITIFESHPNPIILLDQDNCVNSINKVASDLFHELKSYSDAKRSRDTNEDRQTTSSVKDEPHRHGTSCFDGMACEELLPWAADELKAFAAGTNARTSFEKSVRVGTETRWYYVELSRMRDISGKFRGTVVNLRDVAERKRAEEALRASERKFHSLFDSVPIGLYRLSPKGRLMDANLCLIRMIGHLDRESFLGSRSIAAYVDHPLRRQWQTMMDRDGAVVNFEFPVRRSDGSVIWVENKAHAVRDEQGELAYYEGSLQDITERKRAEEKLRQSEKRYRSLFTHNHAVMLLIDPKDGSIMDANPAACRFYGWSTAELLAKRITDINVLDSEPVFDAMNRTTEEGRRRFYFRHRLASGEIRDVEVYSGSIHLYGRELLYSIVHDITDRKRAEDQVKAALEEKEVLLQEIHHRVKNNLQVISSLLSLQAAIARDEAIREVFEDAQNRVSAMALIHQVLYEGGSVARIDLKRYLSSLVEGLCQVYGACGGFIRTEVEADNLSLGMDQAIPCGLVINELVSNALKYAFPNGRTGEIRVRAVSIGKNGIELTVKDTGVGLPQDLDIRNSGTLGFRLVTLLLENQLRGSLEIGRDDGTCFIIRFDRFEE